MSSPVLLEGGVEEVEVVQLLDVTLVELVELLEDVEDFEDIDEDVLLVLFELLEAVVEVVADSVLLLELDAELIVGRLALERRVDELEGELTVEELGELEAEEPEESGGLELGAEMIS